jgi:hypothetical protein
MLFISVSCHVVTTHSRLLRQCCMEMHESLCMRVCLTVYLCFCVSVSLSDCVSVFLCICVSVCLCICAPERRCVYVPVPFNIFLFYTHLRCIPKITETTSLYQNAQKPSVCHLHRESEARRSCNAFPWDDVSCLRCVSAILRFFYVSHLLRSDSRLTLVSWYGTAIEYQYNRVTESQSRNVTE